MTKPLTPKQEKFCQEFILNDGNGSEAYRQSYSAKNMNDKTINEAASRLKTDSKVAARIRELQTVIEEEFVITAVQKKKWLKNVIESCIEKQADRDGNMKPVDAKAVTGAIAELNKMDGDLASIKTESTNTHKFEGLADEDIDARLRALQS